MGSLFGCLFCGMVVTMRPAESDSSVADEKPVSADLNLPVFTAAQIEHWPSKMTWSDAVRHFAAARERYMREFDSPDERLRSKNPARFEL